MRVAESICSDLKAQAIPHPLSKVNKGVTASIGIASTVPNPEASVEWLIREADRSLYQAKLEGRDRIIHLNPLTFFS